MLPDDATPQVDCLIALAQAEHPGYGRTEQAEFYEAVHMELAPAARQLERDARKWRMRLHQLRLDVLSVMPENWREDPDWVKLAENQKLTTKVSAGETAKHTTAPTPSAQGERQLPQQENNDEEVSLLRQDRRFAPIRPERRDGLLSVRNEHLGAEV